VALLVTCSLVLSAPALAAAATRPRDAAGDAHSRVESARRAANASASRYLEALGVFERLRVQATGYEAAIADGEKRASTLRNIVQQRAARAYRGAGTSLPSLLTVGDLPDLMRSDKLLATANTKDSDALSLLLSQQEDLRAKREDLRQLEDRQGSALIELQRSSKSADAQLSAALRSSRDVQARLAAQAAATRIRITRTSSSSSSSSSSRSSSRTITRAPAAVPIVSVPAPSSAGSGSHHDDPFLSCVRQRESRGSYGVVNPSGPYYGAYQFLASTWNITARHAGRLDLVGVLPSNASPGDQDDMAWSLYQWQGSGPWGGSC
jgi:Transglycosylase-like domain